MHFHETKLSGAYVIEPERISDERGFFARTWCRDELAAHGLSSALAQCNISFNQHAGTLRGLHYQAAPFGEIKIVRCTMGAIYDVIVDLRPGSPTFTQYVGIELSARNRLMLYIPEGFAHGFQSLADESEVAYQMSQVYAPGYARGVRYDDPALGIVWPRAVSVISERDQLLPTLPVALGPIEAGHADR